MRAVLLGLIFLLELGLLVAAAVWGFTLDAGWPVRLLAGVGAPVLLAAVWGVFCSPKAAVALPAPAKLTVQAACFVTGGLLLALAGRACGPDVSRTAYPEPWSSTAYRLDAASDSSTGCEETDPAPARGGLWTPRMAQG